MDETGCITEILDYIEPRSAPDIESTTGTISVTDDDLAANINLTPSGVSAGTYGDPTHAAIFTVDQYGRITDADETPIDPDFVSLSSSTLTVANAPSYTVDLTPNGVVAGTYGNTTHCATVTVDQYGRISSATQDDLPTVNSTTLAVMNYPAMDVNLASGIVTPGTYGNSTHFPIVSVDTYGRTTAVSVQVLPTTPSVTSSTLTITGGPAYTINLTSGIVSPTTVGSSTIVPTLTIDTYGRITSVFGAPIIFPQVLSSNGTINTTQVGNDWYVGLISGVATPGTYGSSSLIPSITVDTYGRITGVTTNAIRTPSYAYAYKPIPYNSSEAIVPPGANTWFELVNSTFNWTLLSPYTTSDFSLDASGRVKYTGATTKTFLVSYNISPPQGGSTLARGSGIGINGANPITQNSIACLAMANFAHLTNVPITLSTNDTVSLFFIVNTALSQTLSGYSLTLREFI